MIRLNNIAITKSTEQSRTDKFAFLYSETTRPTRTRTSFSKRELFITTVYVIPLCIQVYKGKGVRVKGEMGKSEEIKVRGKKRRDRRNLQLKSTVIVMSS